MAGCRLLRCTLGMLLVAGAHVASGEIITGPGAGGGPQVKVFDGLTNQSAGSFFAFTPSFTGGVRVAAGDVNGDGVADRIAGTGPETITEVKVFDGATNAEIDAFFPYTTAFRLGVYVAAGDVNGDGFDDIVTGADAGGGPHVKVFSGQTGGELLDFDAFNPSFTGGVRVAAGDVNGDGLVELVAGAGPGGGPQLSVFDGQTGGLVSSFLAYPATFAGGIYVATGDVNGDGIAEVITGADAGGGPHVRVFDGLTGSEQLGFFAYDLNFTGGVRVAAADLTGDGKAEIITGAGAGGGPHVKVFDGQTGSELSSFFAYDLAFTGGVYVAAANVIPEPSTAVLLAVGCVAAGWALRGAR